MPPLRQSRCARNHRPGLALILAGSGVSGGGGWCRLTADRQPPPSVLPPNNDDAQVDGASQHGMLSRKRAKRESAADQKAAAAADAEEAEATAKEMEAAYLQGRKEAYVKEAREMARRQLATATEVPDGAPRV